MAPVFAMKLLPQWNARIDGGRVWKDGKPLLGPGKTWRGLVAGTFLAAVTAIAQSTIRFTDVDFTDFYWERTSGPIGPIVLGAALGFGAIVGDAVKSFFKRRTGREGGAPWFPFDQLDFVAGGLFFLFLGSYAIMFFHFLADDVFWTNELWGANWPRLLVLLILTPALHFIVNVIGYKLKLKSVPW